MAVGGRVGDLGVFDGGLCAGFRGSFLDGHLVIFVY